MNADLPSRACGRCAHGEPSTLAAGGIDCRRNPPQIVLLPGRPSFERPNEPMINVQALHPTLAPNHHCGEFKPQEQA